MHIALVAQCTAQAVLDYCAPCHEFEFNPIQKNFRNIKITDSINSLVDLKDHINLSYLFDNLEKIIWSRKFC